jgi:drug/metabolite transporter (DMT)-like permease
MASPSARPSSTPLRWQVWAVLGIVYVVWGSTYLAIRIAVRTLPPLLSASGRFLVAGLLLLALAAARRELRSFSWKGVALAAVPGLLLVAGGNGGVMIAEQTLPSAYAALIVASSPLAMAVIEMILDRRLVAPRVGLGLLVGFAGLALLLRPAAGSPLPLRGAAIVLGGSILWAAGSVFAGRRGSGLTASANSAFQMLSGGVALGLIGLLAHERFPAAATPGLGPAIEAMAYLVVFGALLGYTAYSWLLREAPISIVSTYAYVNPVVAIVLGVLVLGEPFGGVQLAAAAVILAGVALIASSPRRPAMVEEELKAA